MPRAPFDEQSILQQALRIDSPAERGDYLDESCAGNTQLRSRLETEVERRQKSTVGGTIDLPSTYRPPKSEAGDAASSDFLPHMDGFRLIRQIGQGGAGEVYEAEQVEPVRRRVAIKFIRPGMDSAAVLARFESERQALAWMDHPNIARVLGGGTTDSGRPFFVMELISGVPLTQYCDQNDLPLRERLSLFIRVCQAIQHAHMKGILHRDIKPSNVLVTLRDQQPEPIVIDFGVAKIADGRLGDASPHTEHGQIVGTLEYMSPEQAEMTGLDIDTRCDIFSLGVLLFELLAGTTPLDREQIRRLPFDEMLRTIREQEPSAPSSRISDSKQRRRIAGELDWIVIKALARNRTRRYETAREFGRDVQNYLDGEPVTAVRPSFAYHFRKFAAKHRKMLLSAAAVVLALVAGLALSTYESIRASRAEQRAEREAAITTAVNRFLEEDLLGQADPNNEPDREITLREVLDRAASKVGFRDQPHVEAAIRETIGSTYHSLGEFKSAEVQLSESYHLKRKTVGDEHPKTLGVRVKLGRLSVDQGQVDGATQSQLVSCFETTQRVLGNNASLTLSAMNNLALLYGRQGKRAKAKAVFVELVDKLRRQTNVDKHDYIAAMNNLAVLHQQLGEHAQAERLFQELMPKAQSVFGPEHPKTLIIMMGLAESCRHQQKHVQAAKWNEEVLTISRHVLGPDHPTTLTVMNNLAMVFQAQQRDTEAIRLFESIVGTQRINAPQHPSTLVFMNNLALLYQKTGLVDKAEQLFAEVLATQQRMFGSDHPNTLIFQRNLDRLRVERSSR